MGRSSLPLFVLLSVIYIMTQLVILGVKIKKTRDEL